jgi:hypothetical protein
VDAVGLFCDDVFMAFAAASPTADAKAHFSVEPYVLNDVTMQQSIDLMKTKIRKSYQAAINDPHTTLRGWAGSVIIAAGRPTGKGARAKAIQDAFRGKTVYGADPHLVEQIQSAETSLCLKKGGPCNPLVDCDDEVVGVLTSLLVSGIPAWIVKQNFGPGLQQHVVVGITDDSGGRVRLDPSTGDYPTRSAPDEVWIDPVEGMQPLTIGVGSAPRAWLYEQRFGKVWASADGGLSWCEVAKSVGLGAPAAVDPYAQAVTDLSLQVTAVIAAGDTYFNAGQYTDAISAYQAAGVAGATNVGPEIDLGGNPTVTQPITQEAWKINTQLAQPFPSSSNTDATNASVAQGYAKQMAALYQQAIDAGRGTKAPTAPMSLASGLAWGLGLGALAGGGVMLYRYTQRRRR